MENFVIERIREMGKDPRLVTETVKAAKRQLEARKPEIAAELRRLAKGHQRLDNDRKNLVEAIAKGKASSSILQRLGELDIEIHGVEAQLANLQAEITAIESKIIDEGDLCKALAGFDPVWDQLFPVERARILRLLIERVTYDARASEIAITFRPNGIKVLANQTSEKTP